MYQLNLKIKPKKKRLPKRDERERLLLSNGDLDQSIDDRPKVAHGSDGFFD